MKKDRSFARLLLVLLPLALLTACSPSAESEGEEHGEEHGGSSNIISLTKDQIELMKITYAKPQERQFTGYLMAPARIEAMPKKRADIGTLISGRVTNLYVQEGDRVKAGQPLFEIQGLEIGEIKGEFIRAQAALHSAKANYERQQKLLKENIAAQKAYIDARAAFDEARAAFSAADQRLHSIGISDAEAEKLIQLATGKTSHDSTTPTATLKIYAPISGIISKFSISLGQLIEPGTDLMEIVNIARVWVVADIYEKDLSAIKLGQRVEVETEAWPGEVFEGKLEFISSVVDEMTRTVKVRSTADNPDEKLRPEMYATMRIFHEKGRNSVVIPEDALQSDDSGDFVFVKTDEEAGENDHAEEEGDDHGEEDEHGERVSFRKVPVSPGLRQSGLVEIIAGLRGDEEIVTSGAFFLKSEMTKESFGDHH